MGGLETSRSIKLLTENTTGTDITNQLGPAATLKDFHTTRLIVATYVSVSAANIPLKKSREMNAIDLTSTGRVATKAAQGSMA